MIMDVLRVLSSPDLEVRRKTLSLTMDLVSMRNVMDVVKYLEKEIVKTSGATAASDETGKYRQLLVRALHRSVLYRRRRYFRTHLYAIIGQFWTISP